MKKYLLAIILSLFAFNATAQSPSLAVGLETLTLNKGQIDVAALTEIIMEKQRELKQEALKRFMFKLFPQTNYTSKYYVQNCLHILLNEKNPQVIEKEILELTTNYALAMGVASVVIENDTNLYLQKIHKGYNKTQSAFSSDEKGKKRRDSLLKRIEKRSQALETNQGKSFHWKRKWALRRAVRKLARLEIRKPRREIIDTHAQFFGLALDMSAAALSDIDELKSKGFFKKKIDYKVDPYYYQINDATKTLMADFEGTIKSRVTPYIQGYDIIKEFHSKYKGIKKGKEVNISEELIKDYTKDILSGLKEEKLRSLLSESRVLSDETDKHLKQIELYEDRLKRIARIKETLETLKNTKNLDAEIESSKTRQFQLIPFDSIRELKELVDETDSTKLLTGVYRPKDAIIFNKQFYDQINIDLKTLAKIPPSKEVNPIVDKIRANLEKIAKDSLAIITLEEKNHKNKTTFNTHVNQLQNYDLELLDKDSAKALKAWIDSATIGSSTANLSSHIDSAAKVEQKFKTGFSKQIDSLVEEKDVLDAYFSDLLSKFFSAQNFSVTIDSDKEFEFKENVHFTDSLSKIYVSLKNISKADKISLNEINYIEDQVIPFLINYNTLHPTSNRISQRINEFKLLSNLLKIHAVSKLELQKYDNSYMRIFGFISNLGKLDKPTTYQQMLDLFQEGNRYVIASLSNEKFKSTYTLFSNSINKYTLINSEKQYVNIDVASFLTEMQQYYDQRNRSRFGLYLTLGLNQAHFFEDLEESSGEEASNHPTTSQIGFASEKLGLRYRILRFRKLRGYESAVHNDLHLNKNAPFLNDLYIAAYGSGLLYSIANTITDTNFDYPQVGATLGLRFYNALDVNFFYAVPFIDGEGFFKKGLIGIGLDIPLGEYLEKIGRKK